MNEALRRLEEQGIIVKYSALVNWDKVQEDRVTAMIDVKVTPKRDVGFDEVAQRISQFPEVTALYLMSGAYDLSVVVEGRSMKEIAAFVSEKLATLDSVISTTTHFIMKKYKHDGSSSTNAAMTGGWLSRHDREADTFAPRPIGRVHPPSASGVF